METSYLFEVLTDYIVENKDTSLIHQLAEFLCNEINSWEGSSSDNQEILKAIELLKEIK